MLTVLCWCYERGNSRINLKAGNKININSFLGPYLKYFSRDKRIALATLGQYFMSREKYFYVRTEKRVNIIILLPAFRLIRLFTRSDWLKRHLRWINIPRYCPLTQLIWLSWQLTRYANYLISFHINCQVKGTYQDLGVVLLVFVWVFGKWKREL